MTVFDRGTMAEKKAIVENEKKLREGDRPATTFHELSQHPHEILPKPEASPLNYPAMRADSPWGGTRLPEEPLVDGRGQGSQLGYRIDEL